MFVWLKMLQAALLVFACTPEKKRVINTEDASGLSGNSVLKIAAYYVGDTKCRTHLEAKNQAEEQIEKVIQANNDPLYMVGGKNTHRLDGNNAALINAEYKGKKENPMFGGEMFLKDNDIARALTTIEKNCRRVLLSIDADEIIKIESDNFAPATSDAAEHWQQTFASDFGDFGGTISCGSEEKQSLCSFANIADGNRYFAYLAPKLGENSIAAKVTYKQQGKKQTKTITVESIALNELQLPTTKLSDIIVNADCGEGNSCLFPGVDKNVSYTYKLKCRVQGASCGDGFTFTVERPVCEDITCVIRPSPSTGKLCTGEATVANLSEEEVKLSCELSWNNPTQPQENSLMRIDAAHLAGKLCVITTTRKRLDNREANTVGDLDIEEGECEREGEQLKDYLLELSFSPAE